MTFNSELAGSIIQTGLCHLTKIALLCNLSSSTGRFPEGAPGKSGGLLLAQGKGLNVRSALSNCCYVVFVTQDGPMWRARVNPSLCSLGRKKKKKTDTGSLKFNTSICCQLVSPSGRTFPTIWWVALYVNVVHFTRWFGLTCINGFGGMINMHEGSY